ncbi:hypothetical protein JW926_11875 [Candidatus Sumerlaeota bacterium]|nr:hypothetical protein [Candidatus Sumerlaeota bacterium]
MLGDKIFKLQRKGLILAFAFLAPFWIWGKTITVGPGGDYPDIQTAIIHSVDGDEIIVSPGRYYENILIFGMNVILRSTDPQNSDIVAATIIDGDFSQTAVTFDGSEATSCVLTGFTITNGEAHFAGGIFGNGTLATISHNHITTNTAYGFPWLGGQGGGIYDCDGLIENNVISFNWALGDEAAGAGLSECDGVIRYNSISMNDEADYLGEGGGVYNCQGIIENNAIFYNSALSGGGIAQCHGTIQNNMITDNMAASRGGGVYASHGIIQNNTIAYNYSCDYGGGLEYCDAAICNCILWGNASCVGTQINECSDPLYCCIQGWKTGGPGNFNHAPRFLDPETGNLHIGVDSPCIDAGCSVTLPIDFDGNARPFDAVDWETRGDGTNFDIGADEFAGEAQPSPTPTPAPTPPPFAFPFCDGFETGDLSYGDWESTGNVAIVSEPRHEGDFAVQISGDQTSQARKNFGEDLWQGTYAITISLYSTNNAQEGISLDLMSGDEEIVRISMSEMGSITATNGEEIPMHIMSHESNTWYAILLTLRPMEGLYNISAGSAAGHDYGIAWNLVMEKAPVTGLILKSGEATGCADSICVDIISHSPDKPVNVSPHDGALDVSLAPHLAASPYQDPDPGDFQRTSEWRILADPSAQGTSLIIYTTRLSSGALTALSLPEGILNYQSAYSWQVRYQDNHNSWSAWSDLTSFHTQGEIIHHPPQKPENWNPSPDQEGVSLTPRLVGSPFRDEDAGEFLTGAEWRIIRKTYSNTEPVYNSGLISISDTMHRVPSGYLNENETYDWQVRYRDSRGVYSEWSQETRFCTISSGEAPTPDGLYAAAGARSVFLRWIMSDDYRVMGYNLYRAEPDSESFARINSEPIRGNDYLDQNLTPFTVYRYCLTSVATDAKESGKTAPAFACVGAMRIFMSNIQGKPEEIISQMITLDNPNDIENENLELAIVYDEDMLTPIAINKTPLTESFNILSNLNTANGLLNLSGTSPGAVITGEGHILELLYQVNPASEIWSQSDMLFDNVILMAKYDNELFALDVDSTSVAKMTVSAPFIPGDLNSDELIDMLDATILQGIITGQIAPSEHQKRAGDINGDFLIDMMDLVILMRMISQGTSGNYPRITHCMNKDAVTTYIFSLGDPEWRGDLVFIPVGINTMEGIAGLEVAINYNPGNMELALIKKGADIMEGNFDYYEKNGRMRLIFEGVAGNETGEFILANLVFRARGAWKQSPITIVKLKLSGENGENLNRMKDIIIHDLIIRQTIVISLIDHILGKGFISPSDGDINSDNAIDVSDLVRFIQE